MVLGEMPAPCARGHLQCRVQGKTVMRKCPQAMGLKGCLRPGKSFPSAFYKGSRTPNGGFHWALLP